MGAFQLPQYRRKLPALFLNLNQYIQQRDASRCLASLLFLLGVTHYKVRLSCFVEISKISSELIAVIHTSDLVHCLLQYPFFLLDFRHIIFLQNLFGKV